MQVIKRNGERADFTLTKINDAIMKAFTATQMNYTNDIIDLLALRVTADFQDKVKDGGGYPGQCGKGAWTGRLRGSGKGLHPLSQTEGKDAHHDIHDS